MNQLALEAAFLTLHQEREEIVVGDSDARYPQFRVRVRADADPADVAELLPGVMPGARVVLPMPAVLRVLHLLDSYLPVNPAAEAAVRRLVAACVARIGGLDRGTQEEWEDRLDVLLDAGRLDPARVAAYFDRYVFDLADPVRPFMQHPALAVECSKSAAPGKLHFDRAAGNNALWWDHTPQDTPMDLDTAFEGILLWRGYGPCGTGAQRTHLEKNTKSMKAGPHRSLVSYFPECRNLFLSAVLSCPPPVAWPTGTGEDLAPWEADEPADPMAPVFPAGPIGLLTARAAHHILLKVAGGQVSECWVAWGALTDLPAVRDPFVLDREKGGPMRGSHRRGLLRDFDALVAATDPSVKAAAGVIRPAWIDVYAQLPLSQLEALGPVRVRAVGYDQDKREMGDSIAYTATTPETLAACLPAKEPQRARIVAVGRQDCERAEQHLVKQLRGAWRKIDPGAKSSPWVEQAQTVFWDRADQLFWNAVRTVTDPAGALAALTLAVYDEVTGDIASSVAGFLPVAEHRKWLRIETSLRDGRIPAPKTGSRATSTSSR
ncbi:type I-E CRISPR-associated protein Cse1/CasA [Streptomyces sp. NPDC004667]|uniref:type I-E CRISPR-associated protein Cse1/CasA n=1 Tax=Streptomyces sp. NPDC004667 TaxID=3154285 RepID=UPI0033AE7CE1